MAEAVEVFGIKARFGLYFINQYQKALGVDNTQQIGQKLQDNPIEAFPIALMVANNNVKKNKKIDFEKACDIIDEHGGISSGDMKTLSEELISSLGIDVDEEGQPDTEISKKK